MTTQEIEEIKEDICDNYCKYPVEVADDSVLRVICNKCPLNRLEIGSDYYTGAIRKSLDIIDRCKKEAVNAVLSTEVEE